MLINYKFINFRLRLSRSSPTPDSDTEDPDKISITSTQHPKQSTSCFRCHPRRWRHQACCFRRVTSKAGHNSASNLKSSFTKPNRINTDTDGNSDPGSLLNASTDELQVHPMGGVASMISSVVSHTATVAATTAGGKVPATRNTFGKRNIKNQVSISIFFF